MVCARTFTTICEDLLEADLIVDGGGDNLVTYVRVLKGRNVDVSAGYRDMSANRRKLS
jgi:hypothetical protein